MIARERLSEGKVSDRYHFSSGETVSKTPVSNTNETTLKSLIETEFNIDKQVAIPFGSRQIKAGSKISLRYFLLFNTISGNIIDKDEGVFFDKQSESRYRDALPRVFDIAIGIESIENVIKREKLSELNAQISRLESQASTISERSDRFFDEQAALVKEAREYSLITSDSDMERSISDLNALVSNPDQAFDVEVESERLENDIYLRERKIANLERFQKEYERYKKNIRNTEDSLKPIEYLKKRDSAIIKTSIFADVMDTLSINLEQIKSAIKTKTPIDNQTTDEIRKLNREIDDLKKEQKIQPSSSKSFNSEKSKYIFLGELKAKNELYGKVSDSAMLSTDSKLESLKAEVDLITIDDNLQSRQSTISLIEELVKGYIEITGTSLENYSDYLPVFDYNEKALKLRPPKSVSIENVGSSSNHMFLHLFFSLAVHEAAFKNQSPFVAPYLLIDQPSRPYWGDDDSSKKELKHTDRYKIGKAFDLLNNFVKTRQENDSGFQVILLEHVPKEFFEELECFHLVEEFIEGNALVRSKDLEA